MAAAALFCGLALLAQSMGLPQRIAAYAAEYEAPRTAPQPAPRRATYQAPRAYQFAATDARPAFSVFATGDASLPRPIVLVLHGMGGNGEQMANMLLPYAQEQGWIVVAPTIPYGDWRDPAQVTTEDLRLSGQLVSIVDGLGQDTGEAATGRILVFGFSRGAQAALRLALLNPDRVQAVVGISAGTYTLPVDRVSTPSGQTLDAPMPYGVSDLPRRTGHGLDLSGLAHIRFLIEVGAADNNEADVPHQWDPYIGKTRVERATRFTRTLSQQGIDAQMAVMPGAGHEVNGAMLERAVSFLGQCAPQSEVEALMTAPVLPTEPPAVSVAVARKHQHDDLRGL